LWAQYTETATVGDYTAYLYSIPIECNSSLVAITNFRWHAPVSDKLVCSVATTDSGKGIYTYYAADTCFLFIGTWS